MVDSRHTSLAGVSKSVFLADHAVETELKPERQIVVYDSFPHWEAGIYSWPR